MKNIPHTFFTVILILIFILNLNNNIVFAEESLFSKAMLDELVSIKCGNCKYLDCLGISKSECSKLMTESFNSCPLKYIESLEAEVLDPVCNTNQFVDLSGISPELFSSCGKYLENKINTSKTDRDIR